MVIGKQSSSLVHALTWRKRCSTQLTAGGREAEDSGRAENSTADGRRLDYDKVMDSLDHFMDWLAVRTSAR